NSMIAGGSVIAGATVTDSFLGASSYVRPGASVEQSIILGRCTIGEGARLKKVIVDRDVTIPKGMEIGYDAKADGRAFVRSKGGIAVVAQRTVFE
ncbi:MAG: glucose-1-phosphate adenylyltransferase, partial [Armatimonadetes bacterium]